MARTTEFFEVKETDRNVGFFGGSYEKVVQRVFTNRIGYDCRISSWEVFVMTQEQKEVIETLKKFCEDIQKTGGRRKRELRIARQNYIMSLNRATIMRQGTQGG